MSLPDVRAVDLNGFTALHHAVKRGDLPLVISLIVAGASREARTNKGNTPLHLAARSGRIELIACVMTDTTLHCRNSQGFTPMQEALLLKQWPAATMMIAEGASPYSPGDTHSFSSLATSSEDALEPCALLKALLADPSPTGLVAQAVNLRSTDGSTPLHEYASMGNKRAVANLVRAGADVEALDDKKRTPLQLAAAAGHAALVPLLATPATVDREIWFHGFGGTPVSAAAAGGHVEMVEALLAAGAEPDRMGGPRSSPLAMAVRGGHMQVVPVLLKALASKHLQQAKQGPHQQQQGKQRQSQHHDQQQRQQQDAQARSLGTHEACTGPEVLIGMVSVAVVCAVSKLRYAPRCCQLLAMVLDQLGPELTAKAIKLAQQQMNTHRHVWWDYSQENSGQNHLAEALLLGCLETEGRRRIPARLQRLVPGVGGGQQQQPLGGRPEQLVQEAVLAAVYGRQQQAAALLGDAAELYLKQTADNGGGVAGAYVHTSAGTSLPAAPVAPPPANTAATSQGPASQQTAPMQGDVRRLLKVVHAGLVAAASAHKEEYARCEAEVAAAMEAEESSIPDQPELAVHWVLAADVQATLLSAWVAARGVPKRELVAPVVAAVEAATHQHHHPRK